VPVYRTNQMGVMTLRSEAELAALKTQAGQWSPGAATGGADKKTRAGRANWRGAPAALKGFGICSDRFPKGRDHFRTGSPCQHHRPLQCRDCL